MNTRNKRDITMIQTIFPLNIIYDLNISYRVSYLVQQQTFNGKRIKCLSENRNMQKYNFCYKKKTTDFNLIIPN